MPAAPINLTLLRRAFVDICRGYSIGWLNGVALYVCHLGHEQHEEYELTEERYRQQAITLGAPTEAARLIALKASGQWGNEKEVEIERQKDTIIRFEEGKRTVVIPSVIEQYDKQIADEKGRLVNLLTERANLVGMTAEVYAQQRLNDHYIVTNVFRDEGLVEPLYPPEVFEDLGDTDVGLILGAYHEAIDPCADDQLRHLAVQDFFMSYWGLAGDNAQTFYGKAICNLTYYQVRLSNIARYFRSIMDSVDISKLEPKARHDPDAIEKAFTSQRNMAKLDSEGKIPAGGMNEADMKALNLEGKMSNVTENLSGAELVQRIMQGRRG